MPINSRSLISTRSLRKDHIENLFSRARNFIEQFSRTGAFVALPAKGPVKVAVLVFFEPSTRTRTSFQVACARLGIQTVALDSVHTLSLSKGESQLDTFRNVTAMNPDVLVVRYNDDPPIAEIASVVKCPVINAGNGVDEHPTQALLDSFTIAQEFGRVVGQRVLIVGDIRHSRVAHSNMVLLKELGAEVAVAGPEVFLPHDKGVKIFADLAEGLEWATVCMALRIQIERHRALNISREQYHEDFGLTSRRLQKFSRQGIIMHPGPVNEGVEIMAEVMADPRCRILQQAENGVYVRSALLAHILELG